MKKIVVENCAQIAMDIAECKDSVSVAVVGSYETIVEIFNILMKSTDAEFVAGEIHPSYWDNYEDAYYLKYSNDELWLGKAVWENHDSYVLFDDDNVYVEEDYLDKYIESNNNDNLIVFCYGEEKNTDDNYCMCLSEDGKGFTFCVEDEFGHGKFKYQGTKELTEKDAWEIIEKYYI